MKDSSNRVTAYKGNQTKQFTHRSWNVMGTDKYGWALVPGVPKEVAVESANVKVVEPSKPSPEKALSETKKIVEQAQKR